MTPDGRVLIFVAGNTTPNDVVKYCFWTGSAYTVPVDVSQCVASSTWFGADITPDGSRIAYSNYSSGIVYSGYWNGSQYVQNTATVGTIATANQLRFSPDGNILYVLVGRTTNNLYYSIFNGSNYGGLTSSGLTFTNITGTNNGQSMVVGYNNSIYTGGYTNSVTKFYIQRTTFTASTSYLKSNFPAILSAYPTLNDNVWRHFVWTIDPVNKTYKHYINGSLLVTDVSTAYVFPQIGFNRTQNRLAIANDLSMSYFVGGLDDFRVYNQVLSINEIGSIYNYKGSIVNIESVVYPTEYNKRMVSYDGKTWTKANSNGIDTSIANHMAWNGTLWVAVGKGDDSITYSYDGITWKGQGKTTFTSVANGVAWNGRLFVAMGSGGNTIAYSSNGLTWTGLGTGVFSTSGVSVSWNGTRWIASGTGGNTMAFSADGINWYGTNTSAVTNGLGIGTNYINGQITNGQILSSSMDFINDNCTNTTVNMVYNELG